MPLKLIRIWEVLLLMIMDRIILCWCIKVVFRNRGHTNPMTGHPPVPKEGLGDYHTNGMQVLAPVGSRDEQIVKRLNCVQCQSWCKGLNRFVELAQHNINAQSTHDLDCFGIKPGKDQYHFYPCVHWSCTEFFWFETDVQASYIDFCLKGLGYFRSMQLVTLVFKKYTTASGVRPQAPCYQSYATRRWISATTHDLRCPVSPCTIYYSFDSVLLCCVQEAGKFDNSACVGVRCCDLVRVSYYVKLDVLWLEGCREGVG